MHICGPPGNLAQLTQQGSCVQKQKNNMSAQMSRLFPGCLQLLTLVFMVCLCSQKEEGFLQTPGLTTLTTIYDLW